MVEKSWSWRGSVVAMTSILPISARLPEGLRAAGIRGAGEDEEQVAETVQVDRGERVDRRLQRPREHLALGPAAGGARDVEARGCLCPAGEDEAAELRQRRVRLVAVGLEPVDRSLRDTQPAVVLR